jgi:hypothetical protein
MQHFAAALYLGEVITKLHTLALIGILERDASAPSPLSFELARANSTGSWVAALRDVTLRVQPSMLADAAAGEWLADLRAWLTRKRGRADETSLQAVLGPLGELAKLLSQPGDDTVGRSPRTPVDLMELVVEVRNKTTGHHAYGADFWAANVTTVVGAAQWIADESPLWALNLVLPLTREGRRVARVLVGVEPAQTVNAEHSASEDPTCLYRANPVACLGPLIWIDPATNLTYLANGSWRDSDSSAEFLCHSVEAAQPGEGCRRRELSVFAIRPPTLPPSETEGEESLALMPGVVPNNLPPGITDYVRRGALEDTTRAYLIDSRRRHLINIRGPGGFGKTSLLLELCHGLVMDEARCPYDAVVWMSARDIDLTLRGTTTVRRGEESLSAVWRRLAWLFGETDESTAREFFETSMRQEPVLLVLDNFETFDQQERAYEYLDDLVQPPAKIVITSRHVFKGDYAVEVKGMAEDEADQLLLQAARAAGVEALMTPRVRRKVFDRCQGHPYAMKLVASQIKSEAGLNDLVSQVLRHEDLLDALFRRSVDDLRDNEDAVFVFLLVGQFRGGLSEPAARVLTEPASIDLDVAVRELLHRSLIEVGGEVGARYDMPAMAREFARRHLAGHILQTDIAAGTAFLRRWPALIQGRLPEAAESIARDVRSGQLARPDMDRAVRALRVLATFDASVWPIVAQVERTTGAREDVWEDAYKRAVEANPSRPDLLYEWSEATSSFDRQVELKVQAVSVDRGNVALASRVANFLNGLYARDRSRYPRVRWSALMGRVIDALEADFLKLDGEALSRLAWLYIHSGRGGEARRVVERGLTVDFGNESIRKLAERQKLRY